MNKIKDKFLTRPCEQKGLSLKRGTWIKITPWINKKLKLIPRSILLRQCDLSFLPLSRYHIVCQLYIWNRNNKSYIDVSIRGELKVATWVVYFIRTTQLNIAPSHGVVEKLFNITWPSVFLWMTCYLYLFLMKQWNVNEVC